VVPADGTGLLSYPVEITDKGKVVIDLRGQAPSTTP